MPQRFQTIHIPLRQGLDTKGHKYAVQPPKLTKAENVVFDEVGAIAKRTGSQAASLNVAPSGTISPMALGAHDDDPVLFTGAGVAQYSTDESKWQLRENGTNTKVQHHTLCSVDIDTLPHTRGSQVMFDQDYNAGYTCTAWYSVVNDTVELVVTDSEGVRVDIATNQIGVAGASHPHVIAVGAYFHIYYHDGNDWELRTLNTASLDSGLGSITNVASSSPANAFDVTTDGTTAWIATHDGGGLSWVVKDVTASGIVGTGRTPFRASTDYTAIAYSSNSGGILALLYSDGTDLILDWLDAATLNDEAGQVQIPLTSGSTIGSTTGQNNVTIAINGSSMAYIFVDEAGLPNGTTAYAHGTGYNFAHVRRIKHQFGSGSTIADDTIYMSHYLLASQARRVSSRILLNLVYVGELGSTSPPDISNQRHYLLVDGDKENGDPGTVPIGLIAQTLPGEAYFYNDFVSYTGKVDTTGHLPQIYNSTGDTYRVASVYRRNLLDAGTRSEKGSEWAGKQVSYTLNDTAMTRGVQVGGTSYFPGGYLSQYDGSSINEAGFLAYPEHVFEATAATTGGQLANGTRSYRFYWEWRNAKGELERSTFGESVSSTLSGGTSTQIARFYVPTLQATNKDGVYLAVYRTVNNGTLFYRCSSIDPNDTSFVQNTRYEAYVLWQDTDVSDSDLVDNEPDSRFNGNLLDCVPAQTPQVISSAQNRLFYIGPEDDNRVYFSQLRDNGEIPCFNETLTIAVPEQGGALKAVEAAEGAVWIFRERAVYVSSGIGPDNTGVNGGYSQPNPITNEVGLKDVAGILQIPQGVLFKSDKGFYLATRNYAVQYVGSGVADYDSETVIGAAVVPSKHQAVFMTASRTLVYDYLIGEWSTWDWNGSSLTVAGDELWWVASGAVNYSDSSVYLDNGNGYFMLVETAWIGLQELLGQGRLRRWGVLSEFKGSHQLKVQAKYNRNDSSWVDTVYVEPNASTGNAVHARRRTSRQRVTAVRFEISDEQYDSGGGTYVDPGNSFVLSGVSLEFAPKKGLFHFDGSGSGGAPGIGAM